MWTLAGGGTLAEIPHLLTDWSAAREAGFWPLTLMLLWGLALAIHAGIMAALWPGRRRRRRAARRRARAERRGLAASKRPDAEGRRWVVVLFTDIVDSTALAHRLGDDMWAGVLARHRNVVRTALTCFGGTEVGTQGDGFLVRFDTPPAAVSCAVAVQSALRNERDTDPATPHVRIGVHAGEVVATDGDVVGSVVNLASRVTHAAATDEILVTEPVADHVDGDVSFTDRGLCDLKGFERPRHLLAVEWA